MVDSRFQRDHGGPFRRKKELLPFLSLDVRGNVEEMALDYILGLSGSFSGKTFLKENDEYLRRILHLISTRMQKYVEMLFQYL